MKGCGVICLALEWKGETIRGLKGWRMGSEYRV